MAAASVGSTSLLAFASLPTWHLRQTAGPTRQADVRSRAQRSSGGNSTVHLQQTNAWVSAAALVAAAKLRSRSRRHSGPRGHALSLRASNADEDFNYGAGKDYWDKRYQNEVGSTYDWLGGYEKFREIIEKATEDLPGGTKSANILDLGCGNARMAEEMCDDGYQNITGLDISDVAIETMRTRNSELRPSMKWVVGDAFDLQFEDGAFDVVIDKSTTDAVSCDADALHRNMTRMMGEVYRVLREGGTYLVFSAVLDVPRNSLQMPHVSFDVVEKELVLPFARLTSFTAVKRPGKERIGMAEALITAEQMDRSMAEQRKQRAEAEKRLKEAAPSSFGVLD